MPAVSDTVAGLGVPTRDGTFGLIRVGGWPQEFTVRLTWNSAQQKWVGDPMMLIQSIDQAYLQSSNEPNWSYLSSFSGGTAGGAAIRCVARPDLFFAAGLRLQDRQGFRGFAQNALRTMTVAPWFYQFNGGDFVVFANDVGTIASWPAGSGIAVDDPPSGTVRPTDGSVSFLNEFLNVGHPYAADLGGGNALSSNSDNQGEWFVSGWKDITLLVCNPDGSSSAVPAVPVAEYLYCTMYAYTAASGGNGFAAGISYEMRWVG